MYRVAPGKIKYITVQLSQPWEYGPITPRSQRNLETSVPCSRKHIRNKRKMVVDIFLVFSSDWKRLENYRIVVKKWLKMAGTNILKLRTYPV